MTDSHLTNPTDEQSFSDGLERFIDVAVQNDVTVERAWKCCTPSGDSWEVEIVPLASTHSTP